MAAILVHLGLGRSRPNAVLASFSLSGQASMFHGQLQTHISSSKKVPSYCSRVKSNLGIKGVQSDISNSPDMSEASRGPFRTGKRCFCTVPDVAYMSYMKMIPIEGVLTTKLKVFLQAP